MEAFVKLIRQDENLKFDILIQISIAEKILKFKKPKVEMSCMA